MCAWCRLGGGSCFEGFELCMSVARSSSFRAGRGSGRASQATSLSYANALSFQHRRRLLHGNAPDRTGPLHFRSRLETQEPRPIKRNLTLRVLLVESPLNFTAAFCIQNIHRVVKECADPFNKTNQSLESGGMTISERQSTFLWLLQWSTRGNGPWSNGHLLFGFWLRLPSNIL